MKSEADLITDDELLLRRVRVERFSTGRTPSISPNAFEPRLKGKEPDTDGISLYRAACLNDPVELLNHVPPDRWHEYGIVAVSVSFLKSLGLSVKNAPNPCAKGHVVIPELNAADYRANKARFVSVKLKLAIEASRGENVVRRPG